MLVILHNMNKSNAENTVELHLWSELNFMFLQKYINAAHVNSCLLTFQTWITPQSRNLISSCYQNCEKSIFKHQIALDKHKHMIPQSNINPMLHANINTIKHWKTLARRFESFTSSTSLHSYFVGCSSMFKFWSRHNYLFNTSEAADLTLCLIKQQQKSGKNINKNLHS